MHKNQSMKRIEALSPHDRYEMAKERTQRLVDDVISHDLTHESNQMVNYSDVLSKQITRSYAGHAFHDFQRALLHYEVFRTCAFWDDVDMDGYSLRTVAALACPGDVGPFVFVRGYNQYGKRYPQWAARDAKRSLARLRFTIRRIRVISESARLQRFRNYRDKLAHPLLQTRAEKAGTVSPAQHGDEKWLLEETRKAVHGFHMSLNGTGFDWAGQRQISQKYAKALWGGVKIAVLE